jgi:hypothetical protein
MPFSPTSRAVAAAMTLALVGGCASTATPAAAPKTPTASEPSLEQAVLDGRSLDGTGNNLDDPLLGAAGQPYTRLADADYADGTSAMAAAPPARYVSNRIYNDLGQNVFSKTGLSHWAFVWGQFLDHTIGLAEAGNEDAPIAVDANDPLERFDDDLGGIPFTRDAAAPGTGVDSPRESVNTVSSFIDAWNVYGGSVDRLEWLRAGPINGDLSDNDPHLLLTADGYLPTAAARPDDTAPDMQLMGRLQMDPSPAIIAGDVRANENIGLVAVQTLFAREHNRIVDLLPDSLPNQVRFEIARRVVGAEEQWITYREFLPALGVHLSGYDGYDASVDPSLTTEFATVGYRAHSFIHGELEQELDAGDVSAELRTQLEAAGVELTDNGAEVDLAVPLNVAFGNPMLLHTIGLDHVLDGLSSERQYANDEMIDDQLRSVLFQVPSPDSADPAACLDGPQLPDCFHGVVDLGAIDMMRAVDHGIPGYNALRATYGLKPVTSFTELTGEDTAAMPAGLSIDDPAILDFTDLRDSAGNEVAPFDDDAVAIAKERRTTVAARLAAIYHDVDDVDAFTGMLAERHAPGAELGELQLAMWQKQFTALRDGDRFFYGNDPVLREIRDTYGIDFRRNLSQVIGDNTGDDVSVPADVFHVADENATDPITPDAPVAPNPPRPERGERPDPRTVPPDRRRPRPRP